MPFDPRDRDQRAEKSREQISRGSEGFSSVYRADVEPGRPRIEALIEERDARAGIGASSLIGMTVAGVLGYAGLRALPKSAWTQMEGRLAKSVYDILGRNKNVAKTLTKTDPNDFTILTEFRNIAQILNRPDLDDEVKNAIRGELLERFSPHKVKIEGLQNMSLGKLLTLQTKGKPVANAINRHTIRDIAVGLRIPEEDLFNLIEPGVFHKGSLTDLSDVLNMRKLSPSHVFKKGMQRLAEWKMPVIGLRPFGTILPGSALEQKPLVSYFNDPVSLAKFGRGSDSAILHTRQGTWALGAQGSRRIDDMTITTSSGMARADLVKNLSKTQIAQLTGTGALRTRQASVYEQIFFAGSRAPKTGGGPLGTFKRGLKRISPANILGVPGTAPLPRYGGVASPFTSERAFSEELLDQAIGGKMHLMKKADRFSNLMVSIADTPTRALFQPFLVKDILPGKTALGTIARSGLGYGLPIWGAVQGLSYLDFLAGETIGYRPSEAASDVYVGAKLAQKKLFDAVGITGVSGEIEKEFPGILDSPLGKFARSAALISLGAAAGKKFIPNMSARFLKGRVGNFLGQGSRFGAVAGATIGSLAAAATFPDFAQSYEDLRQVYSGTKREPVRKGQFWFLGRDPYEGGKVTHFSPNWYRNLKSKYRDKAIYGSSANYWRHGTLFPTPHNLFGTKALTDPYAVERRHYFDRPYPVTGGFGAEFPIVGPGFAATIGQLIKPTVRRAGPAGFPVGEGGVAVNQPAERGFRGISPPSMERLAVSPISYKGATPVTDPSGLAASAGLMVADLENFVGLKGFYSERIRSLFGGDRVPFQGRTQLAQSGAITSFNRQYFETEIPGGAFGLSELYRRVLRRPSYNEVYNPLPNTMPSWLPGTRASQTGDRSSYIDFHTGDPYASIKQGEARLPGAGYEALYQLHGRTSYDMVDQFFILADVAPWSQAFTISKTSIEGMLLRGELPPLYMERYITTLQEMEQKKNKINARDDTKLRESTYISAQIEEILSPTSFRTKDGVIVEMANSTSLPEQAAQILLANANDRTSAQAELNETGPIIRRLQKAHAEIQEFMTNQAGRQIILRVDKDEDARYTGGKMQATWEAYDRVSRKLEIPQAEKEAFHDPNVVGDMYREAGGLVGEAGFFAGLALGVLNPKKSLYSRVVASGTSALTGGLIGGLVEQKFTGGYSPADHYEHFNLRSTNFAGWDRPYENFIRGWWHEAIGKVAGEGYVPGYRQEQRDVEEYFDLIKYEKYARLESQARSVGANKEAQAFDRQKRSTMIYMSGLENIDINTPGLKAALPSSEAQYFYQFAQAKSNEERLRIVHSVSQSMARIMLLIWKNQLGATREFANEQLRGYYDTLVQYRLDMNSDEYAQSVSDQLGMAFPSEGSSIWHPNVPVQQYKYQYLTENGYDIHQFGLWENQAPLPPVMFNPPDMASAMETQMSEVNPAANDYRRFGGDEIALSHTGDIQTVDSSRMSVDSRFALSNWRRNRPMSGAGLY